MNERAMELVMLNAVPDTAVPLGEGVLSWCRYERVGDRYGTVALFDTPMHGVRPLDLSDLPDRGRLLVEIVEVRESHHIGDLFHGFAPGGAEVGDVVALNPEPGKLYVPTPATRDDSGVEREGEAVGVIPDDGRETFWLSPAALYRCHDQTVRLWAEAEYDG